LKTLPGGWRKRAIALAPDGLSSVGGYPGMMMKARYSRKSIP
jgi:hypothetical protein